MQIKCPKCDLLNDEHLTHCWECKYKFTDADIKEAISIDESFIEKFKQFCSSRHDLEKFIQWVRYGARLLDFIMLYIISFLIMLGLKPILETLKATAESRESVVGMVLLTGILFITYLLSFLGPWLVLESLLLSKWGTTPGKKLMGVIVRDKDGNLLDYKTALKRTLKLWMWGLGFKIPLITAFCQLYAYQELQKSNDPKWDKDLKLKVSIRSGNIYRVILVVIVIISFFAINGPLSILYM